MECALWGTELAYGVLRQRRRHARRVPYVPPLRRREVASGSTVPTRGSLFTVLFGGRLVTVVLGGDGRTVGGPYGEQVKEYVMDYLGPQVRPPICLRAPYSVWPVQRVMY
eukprot:3789013-Rhodomonas_salina.1